MPDPSRLSSPDPQPRGPVHLEVSEAEAGSRLDLFLAKRLDASRREVRRWLERGWVSGEGRLLYLKDKGVPLSAGSRVSVEKSTSGQGPQVLEDPDLSLEILAEGEGWLAVNKPAGIPVHPLHDGEAGTVLNALVAHHPGILGVGEGELRSGVIHRLDVETSGVLLVGTEASAWERLREAFRSHRVKKVYRALVSGTPEWPEGVSLELKLRVAQHRPARVRVVPPDSASAHLRDAWVAQQEMQVLETFGDRSLVEVRPRTGFLHQIRATLAHLGHPVLGDKIYAAGTPAADRHMLHAAQLEIDEVMAKAPDPADFSALLKRFRAENSGG